MAKPTYRSGAARGAAAALFLVALTGTHTINVPNGLDRPFTIYVDAQLDDAHIVNDERYVGSENTAVVTGEGRGEVVLYPGHSLLAPRLLTISEWSEVSEPLEVEANEAVALPVRIHVLVDYTVEEIDMTWDDLRDTLEYSVLLAISIFQRQRAGVVLSLDEADIIDQHTKADASDMQWFWCKDVNSLDVSDDFRPDPNYVNVYVMRTVDGGSGTGSTCTEKTGVIAISFDGLPHLLAHELGHALGLSQATASMRKNNVMQESAAERETLYGGQIFRAAFSSGSILNAETFPVRLKFPYSRDCPSYRRVPDVPAPNMIVPLP
jgi:hypothetical protein